MTAKVNISLRIDARAIEEADRHVEWMREHHGVEITRSDALRMAINTGQILAVQHRMKEGWVSDDLPACEACGVEGDHASCSSEDGDDSFYVCKGCLAD